MREVNRKLRKKKMRGSEQEVKKEEDERSEQEVLRQIKLKCPPELAKLI